jgi:hypothetical protein
LEVHVPLSEHEQRLLSQMEQQLLAEDPKFASAMRGSARGRGTGRRVLVGSVAVVVGMVLLVLAVALDVPSGLNVVLGVAAFLVMLAGAGYAMSSSKKKAGPAGVVGADGRPQPRPSPSRGSRRTAFMERLEQRWQRRRDER